MSYVSTGYDGAQRAMRVRMSCVRHVGCMRMRVMRARVMSCGSGFGDDACV